MSIHDGLFSTPEMTKVLSDRSFLRGMLDFEVALASALAGSGIIPEGVSQAIAAIPVEAFDLATLSSQAAPAGNVCIPFVKRLTVMVAEKDPAAAAFVHWGATSQDVIDTALMLQMRAAYALLQRDLEDTCEGLCGLIGKYRHAAMPGRTWLQQGPPVTLGLKIASWLDALERQRRRMRQAVFLLQFGGAVGTLAALGDKGIAVGKAMASQLKLTFPAMPWHTQRDPIAELTCDLAILTGSLGKIARDVSLLMQNEVGEFMEPAAEGRGGSSTMPHKRNPVSCAVMLSAAVRVPGLAATILSGMVQEHERGLGGWHAEWETITAIFRLTAGSLSSARSIAQGGVADLAAMRRDLHLLQGLNMAEAVSFAMAARVGKSEAHHILEEVSATALREHLSLKEALCADARVCEFFTPEQLEHLLDPLHYLGSTQAFIEAVLESRKGGSRAND